MIDLTPACQRMTDLLHGVADDQLTAATPCTEYTVADLLEHVDQVARGFTALASGEDEAPATAVGAEPGWRATLSDRVLTLASAWADPSAWHGATAVPGASELSNETWGRIALTEIVVHGWDLAKATGQPFSLPEETLQACLAHVADFVPKAPLPELWGTTVQVPAGAPTLDRIVAVTGRTP